jgi:hypothetical protein
VAVCPKSLNSIYGTHSPLGINEILVPFIQLWFSKFGC